MPNPRLDHPKIGRPESRAAHWYQVARPNRPTMPGSCGRQAAHHHLHFVSASGLAERGSARRLLQLKCVIVGFAFYSRSHQQSTHANRETCLHHSNRKSGDWTMCFEMNSLASQIYSTERGNGIGPNRYVQSLRANVGWRAEREYCQQRTIHTKANGKPSTSPKNISTLRTRSNFQTQATFAIAALLMRPVRFVRGFKGFFARRFLSYNAGRPNLVQSPGTL